MRNQDSEDDIGTKDAGRGGKGWDKEGELQGRCGRRLGGGIGVPGGCGWTF